MVNITLRDILKATGGELRGSAKSLSVEVSGIVTDSRKIQENSLFFALVGEKFDGHDYLSQVLSQGAVGCVISKELEDYREGAFYILVKDTKISLGDLAKFYKKMFSIPFIAVTGSVGKTTAKDMISCVLSEKYDTLKTDGNFNNDIGLPLTLFRLENHHQACVLELGMNHLGEIDYLGQIVEPDIVVITNIGDAHIEHLGSRENIFQAKTELLPYLSADGLVIVNGDDDFLPGVTGDFSLIQVGQGPSLDYRGTAVTPQRGDFLEIEIQSAEINCKVKVPAIGKHMIYPTLMAVAVGKSLNMDEKAMVQGISRFKPSKMRMNQVVLPGNITILDDTYNANAQSMMAGIDVLVDHFSGRKVAVLGDMLELGEYSVELHKKVGDYVGVKGIDLLVTVGQEGKNIGIAAQEAGMKAVFCCDEKKSVLEILKKNVSSDFTLLAKASRGMAFETIVQEIFDEFSGEDERKMRG